MDWMIGILPVCLILTGIYEEQLLMIEYKDIPGFEGAYAVSVNGVVFSHKSGRALKSIQLSDGYMKVNLILDGKRYERKIHQLVLETFVGSRPEGYITCHNDDDRSNNVLTNLRWDTPSSNIRDAMNNGKHRCVNQYGALNSKAKFSEEEVEAIRIEYENSGISQEALGRKHGVSQASIWAIVNRVSYAHS
jgi:hypothetical protein